MRSGRVFAVALALLILAVPDLAGGSTADAGPQPTVWLCKPGSVPNPCTGSQATVDVATGKVTPDLPYADPAVDCFYVYPTVSLEPGANSDTDVGVEETLIARQQAQRFSPHCRIFAPMYRQSTLIGLATSPGDARSAALAVAYQDVERAWDEYMSLYNDGRGVVLIGHSQGAYLLRALMRAHVDQDPVVRSRLVSALLLGGNVLVERGAKLGGDFSEIPACTEEGQYGCVVAFSTFGGEPPPDSRFGRSPSSDIYGEQLDLPFGPDYEVLCTNPASLAANDRTPVRSVLRSVSVVRGSPTVVAGASALVAPTPFVVPAQQYTARCESDAGAQVLRIDGGDPIRPLPTAQWGLHLQDVNIAMGDLTDLVDEQTRRYLGRE